MDSGWTETGTGTERTPVSEEKNTFITRINDTSTLENPLEDDDEYRLLRTNYETIEGIDHSGEAVATVQDGSTRYNCLAHFVPRESVNAVGNVESVLYSTDDLAHLQGQVVAVTARPRYFQGDGEHPMDRFEEEATNPAIEKYWKN